MSYRAGSQSISVNNNVCAQLSINPINVGKTPQFMENVVDSDDQVTIIGSSNISDKMKNRKRKAVMSVRPPLKRKLSLPTPPTRMVKPKKSHAKTFVPTPLWILEDDTCSLPDTKELPNALACHQLVEKMTPASWRGILDNISMEELCNFHSKSYARQAVLDNYLNSRTRELVQTVVTMRQKMDTILAKERNRDHEYAELEAKCKEALEDLEKNPVVQDMRAKINSLEGQLRESQAECGRLSVEEAKVSGYRAQITKLESKCTGLKAERSWLCEQEIKLCEEMDGLKLQCKKLKKDRAEVVSKVIPYIAMELYHNDEMGEIIGKLVNAAIFYGTCKTLEKIAETKKPVVLSEVSYYRPTSEQEYDDARNAFASAEFSFLTEVTKDPFASIEDLLSKKPRKIQPPSPTRKIVYAYPLSTPR